MPTILESILDPMSRNEFRESYYGKRPLHIQGHAGKFAGLYTWDDLNQLLNGSPFPHARIELSDSRGRRQPQTTYSIVQECRAGASLTFRRMHLFDPKVAELVRALESETGERMSVNLYFSQPGEAAFPIHYDGDDVIVLHVYGRKAWWVYDATASKPTPAFVPQSEKPPDTPILECELNPGDVLYVPRGYWHHALARGGMSLQLTITIEARSGGHFLQWLVDELQNDVRVRDELPLSFADEAAELREQRLRDHLAPFEELILERLRDSRTIPSFIRHGLLSDQDARPFKFPAQLVDAPASKLGIRRFTRPARQRFLLDDGPGPDQITLTVWGHIFYFQNAARPLVEFVFSQTAFAYDDALRHAGELPRQRVLEILDPLLREGIVDAVYDA